MPTPRTRRVRAWEARSRGRALAPHANICSPITSQGHPYGRFRRSLSARNPTLATAAAHELEQLGLDDALGLVLLYREAGDERFERAALRGHARLCIEAPALGRAGARLSAQGLIAIGAEQPGRGVEALSELLERAGSGRALAALDERVERRGRG